MRPFENYTAASSSTNTNMLTNLPKLCGDSDANAYTWEDKNNNGIWDSNELPLSGVCITANYLDIKDIFDESLLCYSDNDYPELYTRSDGFWMSGDVGFGGCYSTLEWKRARTDTAEQCKNIMIYAYPPSGYDATTPTIINNCTGKFGFIKRQ